MSQLSTFLKSKKAKVKEKQKESPTQKPPRRFLPPLVGFCFSTWSGVKGGKRSSPRVKSFHTPSIKKKSNGVVILANGSMLSTLLDFPFQFKGFFISFFEQHVPVLDLMKRKHERGANPFNPNEKKI